MYYVEELQLVTDICQLFFFNPTVAFRLAISMLFMHINMTVNIIVGLEYLIISQMMEYHINRSLLSRAIEAYTRDVTVRRLTVDGTVLADIG